MKAIWKYGVPFAVGAAAAVVADCLLSVLWFDLGWRKPVADWMIAVGMPTGIAAYWAMVWVDLPNWVAALCIGLVVGAMRRKSSWVGSALATCVGFMLTPHLLMFAAGYHPWVAVEFSVAVKTFLWGAVSVPLIFLGAWLTFRYKRPKVPAAVDGTGCKAV